MPAIKRLPTKTIARETVAPETAAPIARLSPAAGHSPRTSAPRDLRDLLEARLSAPATTGSEAPKFSPMARVAIVTMLAGLAWTPIAAAAYFTISM